MIVRAILISSLIAAVAPAVVLTPAASAQCAQASSSVLDASTAQMRSAVVCLINDQRTERGLPRLRVNAHLNRSAQGWTNVMVDDHEFTHGTNFAARIRAAGYDWSAAGENIATGFATPAAVVNAWMASTGHCRNILSPTFAAVGTGVSRDGVRGYGSVGTWTQDFGLWIGNRPPSRNSGPAAGCPY